MKVIIYFTSLPLVFNTLTKFLTYNGNFKLLRNTKFSVMNFVVILVLGETIRDGRIEIQLVMSLLDANF